MLKAEGCNQRVLPVITYVAATMCHNQVPLKNTEYSPKRNGERPMLGVTECVRKQVKKKIPILRSLKINDQDKSVERERQTDKKE